ncbi:ribosome hibernation-promoting factor, HPF/YfiA family [Oribacterium sinus]|uniref:ribosome hibernation-promoting factor, HPF/YfiA family n=1 Tax=Oribacterium sinus TaxID=237576 RepID=UPI0028EADC08|nr:ribosome-associated translation inhibitor RaiA [Oribacterium sinus]
MKITITGRNLSLTDGLKNGVEKKLGKLDKFFQAETPCNVTLSTQKDMQKIEVTIPVKGSVIRAEEATEDMYQSIDLVVDVLERQIRKYKNKLIQRHQAGSDFSSEFIDEKPAQDEEEIKIVRTKHIDLKPMTAEEACLQMELLGHSFFVFQDGNTGKVNVVYKRKANSYGLIKPEE